MLRATFRTAGIYVMFHWTISLISLDNFIRKIYCFKFIVFIAIRCKRGKPIPLSLGERQSKKRIPRIA